MTFDQACYASIEDYSPARKLLSLFVSINYCNYETSRCTGGVLYNYMNVSSNLR